MAEIMQTLADIVEIERFKQQNEKMREALEWYADADNYDNDSQAQFGDSYSSLVCRDEGKKAKAALEETNET